MENLGPAWRRERSSACEIAPGQEAETQSLPDRFFLCGIIGVSQTVQQGFHPHPPLPPPLAGGLVLLPFSTPVYPSDRATAYPS